MAIIKKKTWAPYFDDVASGKKKFDFRVADFEVKEGDILVLEEWDNEAQKYTGRTITKKITYVGKFTPDSFGQKEELEKHGFCILSLE